MMDLVTIVGAYSDAGAVNVCVIMNTFVCVNAEYVHVTRASGSAHTRQLFPP